MDQWSQVGILPLISLVLGYHSVFTESHFFLPFIPTPFWIYIIFPLLIASNKKPSFCCQPLFGLLCFQYYPFVVHILHSSTWILVHYPEQEVLGSGFFFPSCSGNTSRLLRVPEQRTGKNRCTQHSKYGQQSYPVSLPSPRATRRLTPKKTRFDDSCLFLLSLKLH